MAQRRVSKRISRMKMSAAFKKAIAAAAMSKLMESAFGEDAAARFVISKAGDLAFPAESFKDAVEALKKIRAAAVRVKDNEAQLVSIARFHYFHCLKQVERRVSDPRKAAHVLLRTMQYGIGGAGKG